MTTRYHKKKKRNTTSINNHVVKPYKRNSRTKKTLIVRRDAYEGSLAYGDLIKAQVLNDEINKDYYNLDDYLTNCYKEWEQWTDHLEQRIELLKSENHENLSHYLKKHNH